ncbi:effector binding domain-containing protein [Konateibacter massiliensis]|uniref:effector binding domain-containing protein n=1 Tax=Konateibacter massiliensis TaxID=2002841 RepID=UPI000C14B345|nr:effector binding domain-containing protein [Konateibacter massiliensis]
MELMTVSEVSKVFHISTRMLRYYEKIGLIESAKKEDYAYRVYDETAISRLQQIIILRKLHIPLKQIAVILNDDCQQETLRILLQKMAELDEDIHALKIVRDILNAFTIRLNASLEKHIRLDIIKDQDLIEITNTLLLPKSSLKEECAMSALNNANEKIESKMDIRILYLPPTTVAASQYIGENPEEESGNRLAAFIKENNLTVVKPDFRVYGFNNPSPNEECENYGYEFWVSVPKEMDVKLPLVKKEFEGGLYAAHCIKMGDFHEWKLFMDQMKASKEYDIDWREPLEMGGCLEEHINAFSLYNGEISDFIQLDLLIPIKRK